MKRVLCMLMVLVMLLSLLPGQILAAGSEPAVTGPALAEGSHEKWIDRIADLPDYAGDFYEWLEDNASADGALADPTLATLRKDAYIYTVDSVEGSVPFDYEEGDDLRTLAKAAAEEAMASTAGVVIDYVVAAYGAFDRDHPEVFWLSGRSRCGYSGSYGYRVTDGVATANYTVTVYFYLQTSDFDVRAEDLRDPALIADAIAQRDEDVERILEDCPTDAPAAVQVAYLNKVLTQTNAYNSAVGSGNSAAASEAAWRCTSALAGTAGAAAPVCEGYSRAFKVLCDELGIPCVLVEGDAKSSVDDTPGAHMWNYVQIDGGWYAVDVTWNDPYVSWNNQSVISGYERDDWSLLGSDTLVNTDLTYLDSHPVDNTVTTGGLAFNNGPVLENSAYELPENLMDVAPYRSGENYTAPVKDGYVFAGWYTDADLTAPLPVDVTTGYAYAKFVDEAVLSVKWQVTTGTDAASADTNLRLVTSVDGLDYAGVSFRVVEGESARCYTTHTAFSSIIAAGVQIDTPSAYFGEQARYFVTVTLETVSQTAFETEMEVIPGWTTLDGTMVEGVSRIFAVSDCF